MSDQASVIELEKEDMYEKYTGVWGRSSHQKKSIFESFFNFNLSNINLLNDQKEVASGTTQK